MSRTVVLTAAALTLLCSPPSALAQSPARGIGVYGSFFAQNAPRPAPPPAAKPQPAQKPQVEDTKPRVVCGTTLIAPRKDVDRIIVIAPPANRKFAVQIIEPQVCASNGGRASPGK